MTVSNQDELFTALTRKNEKLYISLANNIELQPTSAFFDYLFLSQTDCSAKHIIWYGNSFKLIFPDTVFYGLLGNKITGEIYDTEFVLKGKTNYAIAFEVDNLKIVNCKFTGQFNSAGERSALVSWIATNSKMHDCKFELTLTGLQVALFSVVADEYSSLVNCTNNTSSTQVLVSNFIKNI